MGLSDEKDIKMLLLDLDCVTIYGGNPRDGLGSAIHLLHPDIADELKRLEVPVVLLTHRSRQDADYIRKKLEERGAQFYDTVSARELFYAAIQGLKFKSLLKTGLSKSFALDWLEKHHGIKRENLVLLDDRKENLLELINAGMKYGLLAPFADHTTGSATPCLSTFNFVEVAELLNPPVEGSDGVFHLTELQRPLEELSVIGEITSQQLSLFERFRQTAKAIRDLTNRLRSRDQAPE